MPATSWSRAVGLSGEFPVEAPDLFEFFFQLADSGLVAGLLIGVFVEAALDVGWRPTDVGCGLGAEQFAQPRLGRGQLVAEPGVLGLGVL